MEFKCPILVDQLETALQGTGGSVVANNVLDSNKPKGALHWSICAVTEKPCRHTTKLALGDDR